MKRKTIAIILALVMSASVFGQKCKFKVDKVDPITGKKTQGISVKTGFVASVGFLRVGDSLYIESLAYMPGEQNFEIKQGSLLDVKLGNDSVLFLPSNANIKPVTTVMAINGSGSMHTTYIARYVLTNAQAAMVKASGIKFTRMHLQENQSYDLELKEKETEKSIASANCIY